MDVSQGSVNNYSINFNPVVFEPAATVALLVFDRITRISVLRNIGCWWDIASNLGSTIYPVVVWAGLDP